MMLKTKLLTNIAKNIGQTGKGKAGKTTINNSFTIFKTEGKDGGEMVKNKDAMKTMEKFGGLLKPIAEGIELIVKAVD